MRVGIDGASGKGGDSDHHQSNRTDNDADGRSQGTDHRNDRPQCCQ
jgi:hypothetical protein